MHAERRRDRERKSSVEASIKRRDKQLGQAREREMRENGWVGGHGFLNVCIHNNFLHTYIKTFIRSTTGTIHKVKR